ncbi:MAG: CotH kinase family protein [Flavobacteriales bacterium]|nr:CotH kinase family protein [Flavobacteriales bacterium]
MHIQIDSDSLDQLYLEENWYSDHEYPAVFVFETAEVSDTLEDVGIRFRGNTAREKFKKSFKISLNTFHPGRKYHGVEKLNVNAETNDPSMIRSRLGWNLYRAKEVTASRSNHVELYINGEYYGLYQNIEHIDDEFVDTWFGNKNGNLYKCLYPANLDFVSNNPDDYKMAPFGERTYEIKTNEAWDNYSDLAAFIGFLNQSNDTDLNCELESFFNVQSYLKIAAIDILTGNWDGYIYNQNNYYLYRNPLTNQFEYMPYDLDNTWGIDWLGQEWTNRNIYNWSQSGEPRPLFNRLMDTPEFRDIFSWHIRDVLENYLGTDSANLAAENLHNFISESALADPYRPIDWDFDEADFLNALESAAGDHVEYAVLNFVGLRKESALSQVENISIAPIILGYTEDFSDWPNALAVELYTDGPAASQVLLEWRLDGIEQTSITSAGDGDAEVFEIPIPEGASQLEYNVSVSGTNGMSRSLFCDDRIVRKGNSDGLVLNEVMTSNSSTVADNAGEFDDWIEVYNFGDVPLNLSTYYFSDNNRSTVKWALPDVTMEAGDFSLFWADRDLEQGAYHSNFRLNNSGENLFLFREISNGVEVVDFISIPPLPTDYSYGRETDGPADWVLFENPTPDSSNSGALSVRERNSIAVLPYPNPTADMLNFGKPSSYILRDVSGRVLLSGKGSTVNLQRFNSGVYFIEIDHRIHKISKL